MKPLCNVPEIALGGQAIDGGFLILTEEEKEEFLEKEPQASPFFRHYMMGKDLLIESRDIVFGLLELILDY